MKEEFFPKVTIKGNKLILNSEAIETMELDTDDAKVILIETTNVEKVKMPKELFIMKTNGSSCDDIENIKDVFPPTHIRKVVVKNEGNDVVTGFIDVEKETIDAIKCVMGDDKNEFKLLVCNIESVLGKEFKEQFDIKNSYYRFAFINDKRMSVGKNKDVKNNAIEERININ